MNQKKASSAEAKFLYSKLFIIGSAFLLSFLITIVDNDLYKLLKDNLLFYFLSALGYFYLVVILSNVKYQFETIYKLILISIYVHVLYFCLMHCHYTYAVFLHFISISIATLAITSFRSALLILILSSFICFYSRPIAEFLLFNNSNYNLDEHQSVIYKFERITIVYGVSFITYICYSYFKFKSIKKLAIQNDKQRTNKSEVITEVVEEKDAKEKFEILYQDILNYFEKKKPFTNAEFNIETLSKDLKTNSTYISKALNQVGSKKFNTFVNAYRIKQVVEELDRKKHKNNTLETIYTKAGFTQQSTFNRIFKEHIGLTPTEYIENLEKLEKNGNY